MVYYIIIAVVAITIGLLVGILLGNRKRHQAEVKLQVVQSQLDGEEVRYQQAIEELKNQHQQVLEELKSQNRQTLEELKNQHVQSLAEKDRSNQALMDAQDRRFDETLKKMTEEVKTSTNDMLKQRQSEFVQSSSDNLGQIVNPLKETIKSMQEELDKTAKEQAENNGEMKAQIEQMMSQSAAAKESADELARVFKHQSKVQGDWGEVVLDNLLASQGLTEGREYETQYTLRDEEGKVVRNDEGSNMRPDVVLHLDGKRDVVVDSKVSLTAFIDYANAETEEKRNQYLQQHIQSLKKHVDELAKKSYADYSNKMIDFVIMFVPHSQALMVATNKDHNLWRDAFERKVFIADEQTLFAALKIISITWTQIEQEQNHKKLYEQASLLVERVALFLNHYENMGKALESAQKEYASGTIQLADKGKSITVAAQKLIDMGAKTKNKKIPKQFLDEEGFALEE